VKGTWLRRLRIVAPIEATTYLILVLAALGRIFLDGPNLSPTLGPVHGVVVLAYFFVVNEARSENGWDAVKTVGLMFAAVVPLGGYLVGDRMLRS